MINSPQKKMEGLKAERVENRKKRGKDGILAVGGGKK